MYLNRLIIPAFMVAGLALTGCTTTPDGSEPLSGSEWRLVEMQSMDDAQGTTRPANRDQYTIEFNEDGTAYIKLDCNRARAPWDASQSGPSSGSVTFGPMASTMAMCGEASLGERLGQQLGFVRTYTLQGGRLYMSLLADGGILVWEPVGKS